MVQTILLNFSISLIGIFSPCTTQMTKYIAENQMRTDCGEKIGNSNFNFVFSSVAAVFMRLLTQTRGAFYFIFNNNSQNIYDHIERLRFQRNKACKYSSWFPMVT